MTRYVLTLIALFGLAACETIEGAGEDLQSAGRSIEQAASETQADM